MRNFVLYPPPGNILLPNLQDFEFDDQSSSPKQLAIHVTISTLLHLRLRKLKASLPSADTTIVLLSHLRSSCVEIESIVLTDLSVDPSSMLASGFSHLHYLGLSSAPRSINLETSSLRAIGSLPHLRTWICTLTFTKTSMLAANKPGFSASPYFPVLQDLDLSHVADTNTLCRFLRSIDSASLRRINVRYGPLVIQPTKAIRDLAEALARHVNLQDITLSNRLHTIMASHVKPRPANSTLISLSRLEHLRRMILMNVMYATGIRDMDLSALVSQRKWGQLEVLTIQDSATTQQCRLTLRSLATLCLYCPSLKDLTLSMDLTEIPLPETRMLSNVQGSVCFRRKVAVRLHLYDPNPNARTTQNGFSHKIGRYVSNIYPNAIVALGSPDTPDSDLETLSAEVNQWIRTFREVREQEREIIVNEMAQILGPERTAVSTPCNELSSTTNLQSSSF
jgi:hypothetical protein